MSRASFIRDAIISVLPAAAAECRGKSPAEIGARALELAEGAYDAGGAAGLEEFSEPNQTRMKKQPMAKKPRK